MPDLSETPTAQELTDAVRGRGWGLEDPRGERDAALTVLQARAEQADRLRDAVNSEGVQYALAWIRDGRRKSDPIARDIDALWALAASEETQP